MKMGTAVLLAAVLPFACAAAPVFVTSDANGGWSNGGYYVHNNRRNAAKCDSCVRHRRRSGLIHRRMKLERAVYELCVHLNPRGNRGVAGF